MSRRSKTERATGSRKEAKEDKKEARVTKRVPRAANENEVEEEELAKSKQLMGKSLISQVKKF